MARPPDLVVDPHIVELSENNAPRACGTCGEPAEFYVFVTGGMAAERMGIEQSFGNWPLNEMLCRDCFREADRVGSLEELMEPNPA